MEVPGYEGGVLASGALIRFSRAPHTDCLAAGQSLPDLQAATEPISMDDSPDTRNRAIALEDRLERTRLRRTGFPAAFLLLLLLAAVFFGDEVLALTWGTAGFVWAVAFGSVCLLGLGINELQARQSIRATEKELAAAGQLDSLDSGQ